MVTSKQVCWIVFGILFVGALLYLVPRIEVYGLYPALSPQKIRSAFYNRDGFSQEDRARQTLATIVGGLAVLAGAGLTLRSVRAAEKSAEIARDNAETARRVADQSAETAKSNIKIAEDKLITDRFTAAVINLSADGLDKMAQRLGGIYALERIARDSPEDHWTVMEVLTAYIRDKRPKNRTELLSAEERKLSTDINEILRVILRRNAEEDNDRNLDIYDVDLFKAYLESANLKRAVMGATSLREAILTNADLREAHLEGADLSGAWLVNADLRNANLIIANMWHTNLAGVNLAGAKLEGAKLADCLNLTQQQLDEADQTKAPKSLPPGLTFPGYVAPEPPPAPPA